MVAPRAPDAYVLYVFDYPDESGPGYTTTG